MRHPDRFDLWCGLDLSGYESPGFANAVSSELERCVQVGARGIGELSDKGQGLRSGSGVARGLHLDDPRLDPVLTRAEKLNLPINLHFADLSYDLGSDRTPSLRQSPGRRYSSARISLRESRRFHPFQQEVMHTR